MSLASFVRRMFAPTRDIRAGFGGTTSVVQPQPDATKSSPDRSKLDAPSLSFLRQQIVGKMSSIISAEQREQLAALARKVDDDYGMVTYALDLIANYSVPVCPKACSKDMEWNELAEDYWEDWCERCDFTGRFNRSQLQRVICRAIDIDGDVGITMDASEGFPQLRFWPTWKIGQERFDQNPLLNEGVILNSNDKVVGYQLVYGPKDFRRVTADQMLLLYEPNRFERYRGLSALRAGLNDIRDVSDIKGFLKLGTKIESALAAVIQQGSIEEGDWNDSANPSASHSAGAAPKGVTTGQLFGGEIPVINGELKQLQSQTPGTNKIDFMDTLAGCFVAGLGLPPAFYLDARLTGPNARSVNAKAQRKFESRKETMTRLARWEWARVIGHAISTGKLPPVDGWQRCNIQSPPLLSIDIGDTASAEASAFKEGRMSRRRFHGNAGADWQDEEEQIFREDDLVIQKAKEQADKWKVPVDVILSRHGFAPKPMAAQPTNQAP